MTKKLSCTILLFCLMTGFSAAQRPNLDWEITRKSQARQVITNTGTLLGHSIEFNYPGLVNCEFPPGSFEEHHGEGGIWVGAITPDNDTLVTTTISWAQAPFWETYPSTEKWDSIWVVDRNELADIPYWPGYVGVSDQDFVMRYNDYNNLSLKDNRHKPLYLEFIQTSYSWSAPPGLSEILVHNYYVTPTNFDLKEVYVGFWLDPNVGNVTRGSNFLDDYSIYYKDLKLAAGVDDPGGIDGAAYSPIGIMLIPPADINPASLKWTWKWGSEPFAPGMIPPDDVDKYKNLLSAGMIMENQQLATGSHFVLSFGPFDLAVGDTLNFSAAEVFGKGVDGIIQNAKNLQFLIDQGFRVPSAPPAPPLVVEEFNHGIRLNWTPTASINPETYTDPYRADKIEKPFEGYRIYKSTTSSEGPWTLIGEYDMDDDDFANNIGLAYEYEERLLLNNIEYYYSVTAFSKEDTILNWPSLESSISANAKTVIPHSAPPPNVGQVAVVPNPYRGDIAYYQYDPPWEKPVGREQWMEQDRRIQFINLPDNYEIKIYTASGDLVAKLDPQAGQEGFRDWNLTSDAGQAIASGIYLFTVENKSNSDVQVGKFVVIK